MSISRQVHGMQFRVAIDVGGGFTDLVAINELTGEIIWSKGETTPHDISQGIINVFRMSKLDPSQCTQLIHGQTLVINTIIQRKGAKVGLITTKGFRDILELQRSNRRDIFNLRYKKPEPFVPRYLRLEVDERVRSNGEVIRAVNKDDVKSAYKRLKEEGVESIAICFINSYANPINEREAYRAIHEDNGNMMVTISSDVTREWREYERTNTAVLNAYVMPLVNSYISRLTNTFRSMNFHGSFYMMLSNGGVASFDLAKRVPIITVESGPVAGVVAGVKIAELIGERNIIVLDGGSTTTKASLVEDLTIKFTTNYSIERDEFNPGYPIKVPIVDIVEIGNGGGSIAWIDELGSLRVGPVSAGADPGPACYGKGGKEPTLTDAYLVVGFLNPRYFLGGQFDLKPDLARLSLKQISERFGIAIEEAAFAVIRLANDNAAQLLRLISVQRGYDPRDFTLIAHGGSGPMLSPFIAEELEIPKIVIPTIPPGNFSAWGLIMSDLRYDVVKTAICRLDDPQIIKIFNDGYKELLDEVLSIIGNSSKNESVILHRSADMRYHGQEHTIRVSVSNEITQDEIVEIVARFTAQHMKEYGFKLNTPIELVNLQLTAIVPTRKPLIREIDGDGLSIQKAKKQEREVFWGELGWVMTDVYERKLIPPGSVINGPAIIEEPTTTILVRKNSKAIVDRYGNVIIGVR